MNGILYNGKPSFFTCDEIPDENRIEEFAYSHIGQKQDPTETTWGELKKKNAGWEYQYFLDAFDQVQSLRRFRECWGIHGKEICRFWRRKGIKMYHEVLRVRDLLIVVILEDTEQGRRKALEILQENESAKTHWCTIVFTSAREQRVVVNEKRVVDVIHGKTLNLDRVDERTVMAVGEVLSRAKTYGCASFSHKQRCDISR